VPTNLYIMIATRNNTASAAPNNKVKYSRLADSDEGYIDLQVRKLEAENIYSYMKKKVHPL